MLTHAKSLFESIRLFLMLNEVHEVIFLRKKKKYKENKCGSAM